MSLLMGRTVLMFAAFLGAVAVAMGAFGAHALKSRLPPEYMSIYQLGVQYHFYHVFVLLLCGLLIHIGVDNRAMRVSAYSFVVGIIIFSGSLYLLAITETRWLGAVTPIGGAALIVGWIALMIGVSKVKASEST